MSSSFISVEVMTVRPSIELSLLGVSSGYSGTTVLEDFDLSIKEGLDWHSLRRIGQEESV